MANSNENTNSVKGLRIKHLSKKQIKVLTWWTADSKHKDKTGIIADGAIRSGKTLIMSFSFVIWAMSTYNGQLFGMAGKSIGSFRRNVMIWLKLLLRARGYRLTKVPETKDAYTISKGNVRNDFYIFGGRDESSQDFVQGMTAAGFFFDEVALMPESFVNQAVGRCSVEGSKIWFNCNPDKPTHWFKQEWLDKAKEKNLYHLHFTLDDNPSLSEATKKKYRNMFTGIFYQRYILGLWVLAEGIIYDMVTDDNYYDEDLSIGTMLRCQRYIIIDYGTTNPMVFLDVYDDGNIAYIEDIYYYDSSKKGRQKTDSEYSKDLIDFIDEKGKGVMVSRIIIDPSATSFKAEIRIRGQVPKDANNEVLEGIRLTCSAFKLRLIKINRKNCKPLIDELGAYSWDFKAKDRGIEQPIKQNDHACDTVRYYVNTIMRRRILHRGS